MIFGETSRRIYLTSRSPIKDKKKMRVYEEKAAIFKTNKSIKNIIEHLSISTY